jgi:hypothetical protein
VRRSAVYLLACAAATLLMLVLFLDAADREAGAARFLDPCVRAVREYRLTDLCLFTEARYTRNPSMADFHAAGQDHPFALEHFPSGSVVPPPVPFPGPHEPAD